MDPKTVQDAHVLFACTDAVLRVLDAEVERMADLGFEVDRSSAARAILLRAVKAPATAVVPPTLSPAPPPVPPPVPPPAVRAPANPNLVEVACSDEDLRTLDAWVAASARLGTPRTRAQVVTMMVRRGPAPPSDAEIERVLAQRASAQARPAAAAEPVPPPIAPREDGATAWNPDPTILDATVKSWTTTGRLP